MHVFVCNNTIQPKQSIHGRHHHHNHTISKVNSHVSKGSMLTWYGLLRIDDELWPRNQFHLCNVQLQPVYFEWWGFNYICIALLYLQEHQSTKITTPRIWICSSIIVQTDPENTYIYWSVRRRCCHCGMLVPASSATL